MPIDTQFSIEDMLVSLGAEYHPVKFKDAMGAAMYLIPGGLDDSKEDDEIHSQLPMKQEETLPTPSLSSDIDIDAELKELMAPPDIHQSSIGMRKTFSTPFSLSKDLIDSETARHTVGLSHVYVPGARNQKRSAHLTVVTKKGTRVVVRALPVPEGSNFANHAAQVQEKEHLEWQQLKNRILESQGLYQH